MTHPGVQSSFTIDPTTGNWIYHPGSQQEYFPQKPKIRYLGLISPVGQSNLPTEFVDLITWGSLQLNAGWPTTTPAQYVFEAEYNDLLENGVLPQIGLTTSTPIYVASGDTHVNIAKDPRVEIAMWNYANSVNVPVPQRPSKFQVITG